MDTRGRMRLGRSGNKARNRTRPAEKAPRQSIWRHVDWGRVRLWGVSCIFVSLWLLLWARAFQVQLIHGPSYAEEVRRQHKTFELLTGRRGNILDRNGVVLARSVEGSSVFVRPHEVKDPQETALFLAKTLDLPLKDMRAHLASKRGYVWISRKIDRRAADSVKAGGHAGVYITREYERVYPYQHMLGQLLGFVDVDDKGIEGLELAFDAKLSGRSVRQILQRDAAGRRLFTNAVGDVEDLAGSDLHLTIDTQIQYFAEVALAKGVEEFGARWAGCLVADTRSGDILAWAEYPFFNPNRPREFTPFVRRNKMAVDALEQGSTVKPFLMAAALQERVVARDSVFNLEKGVWSFKEYTIRDSRGYDSLPAHKILRVSSNIGVAKIGLKLGAGKYHSYLARLGFGARTGLPLAGESRGILRDAKQWADIDLAAASFGQSFSATAAQMAQAYLCLANDGEKMPLRLVATEVPQDTPARVFSAEVVRQVREMLRDAVAEEGGTGAQARISGVDVGGKTGTAQKASGDAYGKGRTGSFVGLVPADDPRFLVLVVFDEPGKSQYGGVVAAPVFRQVMTRTLAYQNMLPDETPTAVAKNGNDKDARPERSLARGNAPKDRGLEKKNSKPKAAKANERGKAQPPAPRTATKAERALLLGKRS